MENAIAELKRRIDIRDIADRLGLKRPNGSSNYHSPHRKDAAPSLQIGGEKYPNGYYDYGTKQHGDCFDLVELVLQIDTSEAIQWVRDQYGIPAPSNGNTSRQPKTLVDHIVDQSLHNPKPAADYLASRGIPIDIVTVAIKEKTVGYNDWNSIKKPPGTDGYGGPATAFIVYDTSGKRVAIDLRYHDPALNGGRKQGCQGEKRGYAWVMKPKALRHAKNVVFVESPINALSAEAAFMASHLTDWTAIAIRGVANADVIDLTPYRGKRILICMDHDQPDHDGIRPGPEAAWALHARLTAQRIAAHCIDQSDWKCNDLNDFLKTEGPQKTAKALQKLETWAIPGFPAEIEPGRKRIFLPPHDFAAYEHFRVREDFTSWFSYERDDEGNEKPKWSDLAGFRIADIARIQIASASATMTGETELNPTTLFAVTAQISYLGNDLHRLVVPLERLFNLDWWKRVGPIWLPKQFLRLVNLWGRAVTLNEREAVNFVGLCWKNGKPHINEGADAYFTEPEKQCPYHNLSFHSGPIESVKPIVQAYAETFKNQSGLLLLIWALGSHLKAFTTFWPHGLLQAHKGAGKTVLTDHLSRTLACTLFSGQSLQSDFRLVTSLSHTSHPVFWEELSARKQEVIDRAVSILQESYKYTVTRRGSELTEFVICAPALLIGESVQEPAKSLLGKSVRISLGEQGPMLGPELPVFPLRQWLNYLAALSRGTVRNVYKQALAFCRERCCADTADSGARRIVENYAAVLLAWRLLREFASIPTGEYPLENALLQSMNDYITETKATRQPWVWILETTFMEIAAGFYPFPYRFDQLGDEEVFYFRPSHAMHHIKTKAGLKAIWDQLPVKSAGVFRDQLKESGIIASERVDPTIGGVRVNHMIALSVSKLAEYGLHPEEPTRTHTT